MSGFANQGRGFTLTVAVQESGAIDLTWSVVPGQTHYVVQRRFSGQPYWVPIAAIKNPGWSDKNLSPGKIYEYRVVALTGSGTKISNAVSATNLRFKFCASPIPPAP